MNLSCSFANFFDLKQWRKEICSIKEGMSNRLDKGDRKWIKRKWIKQDRSNNLLELLEILWFDGDEKDSSPFLNPLIFTSGLTGRKYTAVKWHYSKTTFFVKIQSRFWIPCTRELACPPLPIERVGRNGWCVPAIKAWSVVDKESSSRLLVFGRLWVRELRRLDRRSREEDLIGIDIFWQVILEHVGTRKLSNSKPL